MTSLLPFGLQIDCHQGKAHDEVEEHGIDGAASVDLGVLEMQDRKQPIAYSHAKGTEYKTVRGQTHGEFLL